jgi:hypothetical protein
MDDAEENARGHADAIRAMGMQAGGRLPTNSGVPIGTVSEAGDGRSGSSGYRRRMAGERTGMHEVDSASSDTSGGSNRSGSSAFRRRKAEEAQELFDEQNWRGRMKEEGEALEADIAANRDKTDKKIGDLEDGLAFAWEVIADLIDQQGRTYVRWTPDVDEDAFLCVFKEDTTTTVVVNSGDCYVDGVAATSGDHLTDTEVSAGSSGVIFMKYVISTDTWTGPTFASARQTPDDDIRYFYLCELADEGDDEISIKPLHRGDIHFFTSAGATETFFIAEFTSTTAWKKVLFQSDDGAFDDTDPLVIGSLTSDTKDANGNTYVEAGLRVMMHKRNTSGDWKYVFFHPIPYMDQYEVITALSAGSPAVTNVRVSST